MGLKLALLLLFPALAMSSASHFTPAEQNAMVKAHNDVRANVKPSASDMQRMEWDDRLATDAYNYFKSCPNDGKGLTHAPPKVPGGVYSAAQWKDITICQGENLYGATQKPAKVTAAVSSWASEVKDFTYNSGEGVCRVPNKCGHYTQVVFSTTNKVGCVKTDCPTVKNRYGIVCRYYLNRMVAAPEYVEYGYQGNLYTSGKPCSKCPKGTTCNGNLCGKGGSPSKLGPQQTVEKLSFRTAEPTSAPRTSVPSFSSFRTAGPSRPPRTSVPSSLKPVAAPSRVPSGGAPSPAEVPAGCKAPKKDLNEQNDFGKVDFQKPLTGLSTDLKLTPPFPVCELDDQAKLGGNGLIAVREAFQDGWSCAVENDSEQDVVVRVQTTGNADNPKKETTWDFYYYVAKKTSALANPGKGGKRSVCRLCGAAVVEARGDMSAIKPLEQATWNFQCRRRCSATLYQHRNFNGLSATTSMNLPNLNTIGLDNPAKISSLKVSGGGCEVRFYENIDYNGEGGKPLCSFTVPRDSNMAAWDMDALRTQCCNERCPQGQDCVKSVAIRDMEKCGQQGAGEPPACPQCKKSKRNAMTDVITPASHIQALERLFKAMADILE